MPVEVGRGVCEVVVMEEVDDGDCGSGDVLVLAAIEMTKVDIDAVELTEDVDTTGEVKLFELVIVMAELPTESVLLVEHDIVVLDELVEPVLVVPVLVVPVLVVPVLVVPVLVVAGLVDEDVVVFVDVEDDDVVVVDVEVEELVELGVNGVTD